MQNLEKYLLSSRDKLVKRSFTDNNEILPIPARDQLIKDIIQFHIENQIFMHDKEFSNIINQICTTFETESRQTYYNYVYSTATVQPTGR